MKGCIAWFLRPKIAKIGSYIVIFKGPENPGITRVIHLRTRVGTGTRVLKKSGFSSITNFKALKLKIKNYRESLQFAGCWGKGKPANCEIRELRGMFSMKTLEMGEKTFQSALFRLSKSRKSGFLISKILNS